ncbi:hypothetical protein C8R45DRAFT_327653 [Mycena sanguinolenta]|nr:hypothetical protein C8R45DRAFT_327653 [Mycena sanguinolenta]
MESFPKYRSKDAVCARPTDEALRFDQLKVALKTISLSKRHVAQTCQLMVAILNVEFVIDRPRNGDATIVRNSLSPSSPLTLVADFLGVPARVHLPLYRLRLNNSIKRLPSSSISTILPASLSVGITVSPPGKYVCGTFFFCFLDISEPSSCVIVRTARLETAVLNCPSEPPLFTPSPICYILSAPTSTHMAIHARTCNCV